MKRDVSRRRVLYVSVAEGSSEQTRPYFTDAFERIGLLVDSFSIRANSSISRTGSALLAPRLFSAYDIVIVSEYFSAWGAAIRALLEGCSTKVIAIGLNQSRKLIQFQFAPFEKVNRTIWNRIDHVVVGSHAEARIFAGLHGIDPAKFTFIHWGYDLPHSRSDRFAGRTSPYVCMIGRNNRDVETFCQAIDKAGIHGILVSPLKPIGGLCSSIEYFDSLSLDDCLSCIRHALANVILITDENRGAGHITAVNAMFLGVPQVFSGSSVIEDYLIDGYNGIAVPIGSHLEVATAVQALAADPALATKLGENGRAFAQRWMTNAAVADRLAQLVQFLLGDIPKPE